MDGSLSGSFAGDPQSFNLMLFEFNSRKEIINQMQRPVLQIQEQKKQDVISEVKPDQFGVTRTDMFSESQLTDLERDINCQLTELNLGESIM